MKSNIKRFLGILLAALMVVTMLPVTAFAEDAATVPAGASFVVGDKTFILMDTTKEINGKTYYGVLSKESISRTYGHARPKYTLVDGTFDTDNEVVISIFDDRYSLADYNPQLQDQVTKFAAFGNYIAPADTEWVIYNSKPSNTNLQTKIYFKGSIGYPTTNEFKAVLAKDTLGLGSNDSYYVARSLSFYQTYYYWSGVKSNGTSTGNVGLGSDLQSSSGGGTWYFMTYVSEDFFKNTKLDVATVGQGVRDVLSAKFYQRDFAGAGYTAEEFAALGILEKPEDYATKIDWSDNYIEIADASTAGAAGIGFLYNETITQNSKNYYGFTVPKDYTGTATKRGIVIVNDTVDPDGEALPAKEYGDFVFTEDGSDNKASTTSIDTIRNDLPTDLKNYLGKPKLSIPGYWIFDGYSGGTVYQQVYITLPRKADIEAHLAYLKPMMLDNQLTWITYNHSALVREAGSTYNLFQYDADQNGWVVSTKNGRYYNASTFPVFFGTDEMFTNVKFNVYNMGANVKKVIVDNYTRGQLDHLYTAAELDAIGVTDTPANLKPIHSADYVKLSTGLELLYLGDDANGDATFMIVKDYAGTDAVEGLYLMKATAAPNGDTLDPANYMEYYLLTANTTVASTTTLDAAALADLPASMKGYLSDAERKAGLQYCINGSGNGTANTRAYFTAPSEAELTRVADYVKAMIMDNTNNIAGASQTHSTKSAIIRDAGAYGQKAYDAEKGECVQIPNGIEYNTGSAFAVFAIDKDFLTEVKIDVATVGANVLPLFANYTKGEFAVDYTAAEFEFLGVKAYYEEVKPGAGDIATFTIGGDTYILTDKTVEENGKKYYLVMNATQLSTDQGPYGRLEETVLDTDASTATEKYFSELKVGSNYGYLKKGSTTVQNKTAMSDIQDMFFPDATFGGYLKLHDWEMTPEGWIWSDGTDIRAYHRAYMSMPSLAEIKAIIAKYSFDTLHTVLVETRTFTNKDTWNRMRLARIDGGETGSGSTVSKDNFAYSANNQGKFYFVAYVSEDWFASAGIDNPFGGYTGEGLGLEVAKTANGAEVIVHNNGAEAAGAGLYLIVASYDENGLVDVKTVVLEESISAGAKTSAIKVGVDVAGATEVKAMLWDNLISAKPVTKAVSAN